MSSPKDHPTWVEGITKKMTQFGVCIDQSRVSIVAYAPNAFPEFITCLELQGDEESTLSELFERAIRSLPVGLLRNKNIYITLPESLFKTNMVNIPELSERDRRLSFMRELGLSETIIWDYSTIQKFKNEESQSDNFLVVQTDPAELREFYEVAEKHQLRIRAVIPKSTLFKNLITHKLLKTEKEQEFVLHQETSISHLMVFEGTKLTFYRHLHLDHQDVEGIQQEVLETLKFLENKYAFKIDTVTLSSPFHTSKQLIKKLSTLFTVRNIEDFFGQHPRENYFARGTALESVSKHTLQLTPLNVRLYWLNALNKLLVYVGLPLLVFLMVGQYFWLGHQIELSKVSVSQQKAPFVQLESEYGALKTKMEKEYDRMKKSQKLQESVKLKSPADNFLSHISQFEYEFLYLDRILLQETNVKIWGKVLTGSVAQDFTKYLHLLRDLPYLKEMNYRLNEDKTGTFSEFVITASLEKGEGS